MNLRTKIFFLIGGLLAVFFSAVILFTSYKLTKDFSGLEQENLHKNLDRVQDAMNERIKNLSTKLGDWAVWDDSYQFIIDHNEEYIQSNLQDNAFDILGINFVVFIDADGRVVFQKFVQNGKEVPFPSTFSDHLMKDFADGEISKAGNHQEFVTLFGKLVVYTSRPITSSDGIAPANGVIIFGYIVDGNEIQEIANLTHLDVTYALFENPSDKPDGFDLARANLSLENNHFIPKSASSQMITGFILISEADGDPVFILRVDMPRDIYQKGQSSILLFVVFILLSGIIFCLATFYLLGHFVLDKIAYLDQEIQRVRKGSDVKKEIIISGKDEIAHLAEDMNQTFKDLEENEENMRIQNESLELSKKATLNILEDVAASEKEMKDKTIELLKFKQAADTSFDHTIITDADGVVIYVNHAAEMLTGYLREEMIGAKPSLWGKQMSHEFYEKMWITIKTEKKIFAGEITNKRKNGQVYLVSARITPIVSEEGIIQFFVGIESDITEERASQLRIVRHAAELQESNELIEKQKERAESILRYLQSIGEGVFATDLQGNIIFINETAKKLVGEDSSEDSKKRYSEVFLFLKKRKSLNMSISFVEEVLKEENVVVFPQNVSLVRKDGILLAVSGTISVIRDENGEVTGTITVFQDATKQRELEDMKNSFLSVAAHQLRTPLGSMRWSMEMLLAEDLGKLPKLAKEVVSQIYENSGRMVVLVNDLLNVSRIDGETSREEKESVNIVSFMKKVIDTMRPEAEKRGVEIIFSEPEETAPEIIASSKHLYEALENLISNGIKYNRENGTLTITLEVTEEILVLKVSDTGIGIPEADQSRIFSKFFRAPNAVLKETEGSGLGLSVVKSYLEENDAKISFESKENRGTTFFVEFPLRSTKKRV